MSKQGKERRTRNWLLAGVIALAVPIAVVFVSFDEVIERSVANGKVLDIITDKNPADQGMVAVVELTEGNRAQIASIPQSVQIGDKLPIIVETRLNKKTTYRLDELAWDRTR